MRITQWTNQNSNQIHVTGTKRGKLRASRSRLVLISHLIGRETGASSANQLKESSTTKQNQARITFDTDLRTALLRWFQWLRVQFKLQIWMESDTLINFCFIHLSLLSVLFVVCVVIELIRAVFVWASLSQNQSNDFSQSQQTQTAQWTNQNLKQIHEAGVKRGNTRQRATIDFSFGSHKKEAPILPTNHRA